MASTKQIHTFHLKRTCKSDRSALITSNSITMIGKTGGTRGGIPVKAQEMAGVITANSKAKRKLSSSPPNITGKNMGKKTGPRPNKWKNCGSRTPATARKAVNGICFSSCCFMTYNRTETPARSCLPGATKSGRVL